MSTGRELRRLLNQVRRLGEPETDRPDQRAELWLPPNGRDLVDAERRRPAHRRTHFYDSTRLEAARASGADEDAAHAAAELTLDEVERITAEVDACD